MKTWRRKCALLLVFTMIMTLSPIGEKNTQAKAVKKTVTVKVGKTKKLLIVGGQKARKIKWSVKNKKIARIIKKSKKFIRIKGLKAGSTLILGRAYIGGKIKKLKIKVKVGKASKKKKEIQKTPAQTVSATSAVHFLPTSGPGLTTTGKPNEEVPLFTKRPIKAPTASAKATDSPGEPIATAEPTATTKATMLPDRTAIPENTAPISENTTPTAAPTRVATPVNTPVPSPTQSAEPTAEPTNTPEPTPEVIPSFNPPADEPFEDLDMPAGYTVYEADLSTAEAPSGGDLVYDEATKTLSVKDASVFTIDLPGEVKAGQTIYVNVIGILNGENGFRSYLIPGADNHLSNIVSSDEDNIPYKEQFNWAFKLTTEADLVDANGPATKIEFKGKTYADVIDNLRVAHIMVGYDPTKVDTPSFNPPADEPTNTPEPTPEPVSGWNEAKTEYTLPISEDNVRGDGGGVIEFGKDDSVTVAFNPPYPGIVFSFPEDTADKFSSIEFTYKDSTDDGKTSCGGAARYTDQSGDQEIHWNGLCPTGEGLQKQIIKLDSSKEFVSYRIFRNDSSDCHLTITSVVLKKSDGTSVPTVEASATPTPKQTLVPNTQNYEFFNGYTLGYDFGIVAYKDGKKTTLDAVGAGIYNKESDNIFAQHIENNNWQDEKIMLTAPIQYTTEDGKAHTIDSMLTNFDFMAEPTAIDNSDKDGKLYVYATTEGIDYSKGTLARNGYNNHSLSIVSTQDMVNWTDEGLLDNQNLTNLPSAADSKDIVKNKWGSKAWAPSGLKIDGDGDGEDEYYLFYSNGGAVGYVQGDSPTGPWKDDLGKVLFNQGTPNCKDVMWCFDPAVLVDDKGDAYVYFGGGVWNGPGEAEKHPGTSVAQPKTGRVCKIKFEAGTGKVLLDGDPQIMDTHYFFEDSEINMFNGKYYYSYCTNFSVPNADKWVGNGQIAVYVSSDPMKIAFDPTGADGDKFKDADDIYHHYLGTVLKNPSTIYGESYNNHHHMQSFKGHDYIFYQTTVLGNILFRDNKQYRNLHVDEITVDKETDDITINPTYEGASQIEDFDPYKNFDGSVKYINATTAANSAGVKSTRDDIQVAKSINGSPMVLDEIDTGDWTCIKGVNFGTEGLQNFGAEYKSDSGYGRIEMFIDSPTDIKNKVASIDIAPNTEGKYEFHNTATTQPITGKHDVYFVFRGAGYKVASWIFSEKEEGSEIPDVSDRPVIVDPEPTPEVPESTPEVIPSFNPPADEPFKDSDMPAGYTVYEADLSTAEAPSGGDLEYDEATKTLSVKDASVFTIDLPGEVKAGQTIYVNVIGILNGKNGFRSYLIPGAGNHLSNIVSSDEDNIPYKEQFNWVFKLTTEAELVEANGPATKIQFKGKTYADVIDNLRVAHIMVGYDPSKVDTPSFNPPADEPTNTPQPTEEPLLPGEFRYEGLDRAWIAENIDPEKPVVAMSFDDGPGSYTSFVDYGMQIQQALKDAGAHATFFYIGSHIQRDEQSKAEVQQALDWGFEIANHSWDTSGLNSASVEMIQEKISKTNALLQEISGYENFLFRAPNVAYSKKMEQTIQAPFIDVSCWSNDYQLNVDKDKIVENVTKAKDGDIINMHSVHEKTAQAVPEILAYFKEQGIQVVSVSELFAIKGQPLMIGQKYYKCEAASE